MAEKSLRENTAKYQLIFDSASEGIMVIQGGKFKFFNHKLGRLIGFEISELKKMADTNFLDWVHPEDRELVADHYIRRQQGEDVPSVYQIRICNKNDRAVWMELSSTIINWKTNRPP